MSEQPVGNAVRDMRNRIRSLEKTLHEKNAKLREYELREAREARQRQAFALAKEFGLGEAGIAFTMEQAARPEEDLREHGLPVEVKDLVAKVAALYEKDAI